MDIVKNCYIVNPILLLVRLGGKLCVIIPLVAEEDLNGMGAFAALGILHPASPL